MGKASYSSGNINLFQRSYYRRRKAKYMGTSDPITIKKHLESKEMKQMEHQKNNIS